MVTPQRHGVPIWRRDNGGCCRCFELFRMVTISGGLEIGGWSEVRGGVRGGVIQALGGRWG